MGGGFLWRAGNLYLASDCWIARDIKWHTSDYRFSLAFSNSLCIFWSSRILWCADCGFLEEVGNICQHGIPIFPHQFGILWGLFYYRTEKNRLSKHIRDNRSQRAASTDVWPWKSVAIYGSNRYPKWDFAKWHRIGWYWRPPDNLPADTRTHASAPLNLICPDGPESHRTGGCAFRRPFHRAVV